jgi:hypothetical protein
MAAKIEAIKTNEGGICGVLSKNADLEMRLGVHN